MCKECLCLKHILNKMRVNNNIVKYMNTTKLCRYYCTNDKSNKYSSTVLLPKTKFPQQLRGKNVSEQSKNVYQTAGFEKLYSFQKGEKHKSKFILHDGPPYANGKPHMGHMINKILKDVINRYQIIKGKRIHYVPGWDCHGLPIELKALNKSKNRSLTPVEIRSSARNFAAETIKKQMTAFQSWGVIADWKNSYLTYSIPYIKNQFKQFLNLYNKRLVYRDFKPVFWSPSSRTALAEAELQYNENHKSPSVILKLKMCKIPDIFKSYSNDVYALIWTTTPWTLPSNQAVCYNPELSYSLVQMEGTYDLFVIATELINVISASLKTKFNVVLSFPGKALFEAQYHHPFFKDQHLPFLPGQHATSSKGTGLVHTAPAHGPDDFLLALSNNIPVKCIVDEEGKYTKDMTALQGQYVLTEGNEAVLKMLKNDILHVEDYIHSYPYDWRTNKPIILRASRQWFIDTNALKERAVELLKDVKIVPERNSDIYKQSLITQVKKRPYWCISRQRAWGVPIPVFFHKAEPLVTEGSINHLNNLLDKHGTDFWWTQNLEELISPDLLKERNLSDIEKGNDIFDIWFDSGVSWSYVLENELVADMYLEGVDQFNGWFQSSLMTSVALRDRAPYKTIFVHGFAVDQNGLKMSKSLGNVVDPQDLIEGGKKQQPLGIDVLRWWVACHASQGSTAFVSPTILQASQEQVQKIRNTLRFALGALNDYTHSKLVTSDLKMIDKYLLHLAYEFDKEVSHMFDEYQFNRLCILVINFITNPVSSLYYSVIKDRLYCNFQNDLDRQAAQFVLSVLLETICKAIAPIMPHLVEEIYIYRNDKACDTFFKSDKIRLDPEWHQPDVAEKIEQVLNIKKYINKQYSSCLDLRAEITAGTNVVEKLKAFQNTEIEEILQVAEFSIIEDNTLNPTAYNLHLSKSAKLLCNRCRKYNSLSNNQLCERCDSVLEKQSRQEATM